MRKILYAGCLIYLQPFRRNSFSKYAPQPEIEKKSRKPLFLAFKVVQSYRWYLRKARRWHWLLW